MVCLRNISVDTLHKGDTEDDDDNNSSSSSNNNNNNNVTTFTQGIYNYIPITNHVSRVYNFTAILWL